MRRKNKNNNNKQHEGAGGSLARAIRAATVALVRGGPVWGPFFVAVACGVPRASSPPLFLFLRSYGFLIVSKFDEITSQGKGSLRCAEKTSPGVLLSVRYGVTRASGSSPVVNKRGNDRVLYNNTTALVSVAFRSVADSYHRKVRTTRKLQVAKATGWSLARATLSRTAEKGTKTGLPNHILDVFPWPTGKLTIES